MEDEDTTLPSSTSSTTVTTRLLPDELVVLEEMLENQSEDRAEDAARKDRGRAGRRDSPADGLSLQQAAVLCDLHLQPRLDVQQHLVFLTLTLQVSSQLNQLLLQRGHLRDGRTC